MTLFDRDEMQLSLEYAPDRYTPFNPDAQGRWWTLSYAGSPMGVVWHDEKDGSGFLQGDEDLVPGTSVMGASMLNTFQILKKAGTPAEAAYNVIKSTPGIVVENETSGKLGDAMKLAHSLKGLTPVTAAAPPTGNASVVAVFHADTEEFLEMVRSDASGVYLRDNGAWHRLPDEDDSLDMTEWIWIDADGLAFYDSLYEQGKSPTRDEMMQYQLPN